MSNHSQPRLTNRGDGQIAEYRALSVSAMVGLLLGLLSPAAMLGWVLWLVPIAGVAVSLFALRCIAARAPALIGRKAALAGLSLSVFFGSAAVGERYVYRWMMRREARQFADAWFELLARDEPHKAHHLTLRPKNRQPLDDNLWQSYRQISEWERQLRNFVKRRPIRTLLALGPDARARYWGIDAQVSTPRGETVCPVYAVSYEEDGETKTFFICLILERTRLKDGTANWQLIRREFDFVPKDL